MDHPTASCRLIPAGPQSVERLALYDTVYRQGRIGQGILGLADETVRREGLLNSGSILVLIAERWSRALASTATLAGAASRRQLPVDALAHARNAALGADVVAAASYRRLVEGMPALEPTTRFWPTTRLLDSLDTGHISGWSRLPFVGRRFRLFGLFQVMEQAPEPERRITLSSRNDRFGQPLPRLHWFISEREQESMRRTQELLAAALARAGVGKLVSTSELAGPDDVLDYILGPTAHHHLGTTRMHPDPKHGVVDENGRVHGTSNLYACGDVGCSPPAATSTPRSPSSPSRCGSPDISARRCRPESTAKDRGCRPNRSSRSVCRPSTARPGSRRRSSPLSTRRGRTSSS